MFTYHITFAMWFFNQLKNLVLIIRFTELIKMIAFRAETSVVNLLSEHYTKCLIEGRVLVKEIINSDIAYML